MVALALAAGSIVTGLDTRRAIASRSEVDKLVWQRLRFLILSQLESVASAIRCASWLRAFSDDVQLEVLQALSSSPKELLRQIGQDRVLPNGGDPVLVRDRLRKK